MHELQELHYIILFVTYYIFNWFKDLLGYGQHVLHEIDEMHKDM